MGATLSSYFWDKEGSPETAVDAADSARRTYQAWDRPAPSYAHDPSRGLNCTCHECIPAGKWLGPPDENGVRAGESFYEPTRRW